MKFFKVKAVLVWMMLLCFQIVQSQEIPSEKELEKFLDEAEIQSQRYTTIFKNLSATEIKTKLYYKTNGSLDDKRVIKSLFIVYESPNTKRTQEYRNVLEYNGKTVARADSETEKFFAKLANVNTAQEEFQKLFRESLRYDGRSVSWGMTLFQLRPFTQSLRPNFVFKFAGKEKIENRDVWVIEYEQIRPTMLIVANPTDEEKKRLIGNQIEYSVDISDKLRPTNPLITGKLWLDAETARIWRNELKINLHPSNLTKPIVSVEITNEYQPSEFDIFVPEKLTVTSYKIKGANDSNLVITKDVESIYEFSKFSEFKSEVKEFQTKNN